jgi:hypothetical protein
MKPQRCDACDLAHRVLVLCERCARALCNRCALKHQGPTGADTAQLRYEERTRRKTRPQKARTGALARRPDPTTTENR